MKRFIGLFAVGALAACTAPAPVDSLAQPIINGVTDSNDPAVVLSLALMGQQASLCTAEVISPHVLLTAAHCVSPDTVGTNVTFHVFFGQQLPASPSASDFVAVKEVHYDTAFDAMNPQNGHDVGIIILAAPTTVAPVPYNRDPLPQTMVGQAARLVGYGITSASDTQGTTAGTRRQAPSQLAKLDNLFVGLQDGAHGICEGDSGGPAFMTFNGTERIVGVTSFGFNGCPLTGQQGFSAGNDTRIDSYASFIDSFVLTNDPPAKGPGAECSSDAECAPRACVQTSVGKICQQSCDPAAMPSTCPDGTQCTDVEGSNICATPPSKSGGGCDVAGHSPVGGAALLFACAMLLLLRRRA